MTIVISVGVVAPHVMLFVGAFNDREKQVIFSVLNGVAIVKVLPSFQDKLFSILARPYENQAVTFIDFIYTSFEFCRTSGILKSFLDVIQVNPARSAICGGPVVIRASGTAGSY
tara:strand:- start:181 stop:522 length:342 start_codon:yes stop_codon:yes gene_type:complete